MEKTRDWLAQHPGVVCLGFAFLVGMSGYQAFRGGMTYGQLRAEVADHARAASEALGG